MMRSTLIDIEYGMRKRTTKRDEFLRIMEQSIPWDEWVAYILPYYPKGKRGRPPMGVEKMLRMYLLQCWFNLSDKGLEDAIYDSYALRTFMGVNFSQSRFLMPQPCSNFGICWKSTILARCFLMPLPERLRNVGT